MKVQYLFILFLLTILFVSSCSQPTSDSSNDRKIIAFETLQKRYVVDRKTPETFILKSESDEEVFLSNHPQDSLPEVDYSEHVVIGVLAGIRSNNSYDITIDSVVAELKVVVYPKETGSAFGERVITYPAHIATLNRSDVEGYMIEFAELERVCQLSPCEWEIE